MIDWQIVKDDFRSDGALRDIYVTPATLDDWRAVYSVIRSRPDVHFEVDGLALPPPVTVDEIFAARMSHNPWLRFSLGQIQIVFHFFSEDEIECDFCPHEVDSQERLDMLLGFVEEIGRATGKRVLITPENCTQHPIISYEVEQGRFQYHPPRH